MNCGMKNILLSGLFLLMFLQALPAGEKELIVKANKAYSAGYYADAVESYKKVIENGMESPELYYNLGNSYFKLNDYAHAILYYEKAKKLDPGNDDIDFNLRVANTKIADKIEPIPELFYKRWYAALVELLSVDGWAKIGIAAFLLSLLGILVYFISNRLILRKAGFWGGIFLFFAAGLFFIFAWSGYDRVIKNRSGIVISPTVTVKSSPDEKSVDLFVLHEGTRINLIDNIGVWYEIRIANGSVGWLPVTAFEKI